MFWTILLSCVVVLVVANIGIIWLPTLQLLIFWGIAATTGTAGQSKQRVGFLLLSHFITYCVSNFVALLLGWLILRGRTSVGFFWLLFGLVVVTTLYWIFQVLLRGPPMLDKDSRRVPESPFMLLGMVVSIVLAILIIRPW
jgi:hypothetical protein